MQNIQEIYTCYALQKIRVHVGIDVRVSLCYSRCQVFLRRHKASFSHSHILHPFFFLSHLKAWSTSVQFCTVAFSQSVATKCVTQQQKALLWKLSFIWFMLLLMQRNGIIVEADQLPMETMVASVIITKMKYLGNSYIMQCIILFETLSPSTYLSHLHLTHFKIFNLKHWRIQY